MANSSTVIVPVGLSAVFIGRIPFKFLIASAISLEIPGSSDSLKGAASSSSGALFFLASCFSFNSLSSLSALSSFTAGSVGTGVIGSVETTGSTDLVTTTSEN